MKNNPADPTYRPYVQDIGDTDINSPFFPPYTEVRSAAGIHVARHMMRDTFTCKAILADHTCWAYREYKHAAPTCDISMHWDPETHVFISADCACGARWESNDEQALVNQTILHLKETR